MPEEGSSKQGVGQASVALRGVCLCICDAGVEEGSSKAWAGIGCFPTHAAYTHTHLGHLGHERQGVGQQEADDGGEKQELHCSRVVAVVVGCSGTLVGQLSPLLKARVDLKACACDGGTTASVRGPRRRV